MFVARQPEQVDRLGGDDQRMGGIETAGDADHDALGAGRAHALHEAGDLDVVGLVAILLEQALVARHEREALDLAQEADVGGRRLQGEADLADSRPSRCRRLSSNVPISARSCLSRSRSTSASVIWPSCRNRSPSASSTPFS